MADDMEKTEQPTPRRRTEARKRGQIAKSQDLTAAVLLLLGLLVLDLFGNGVMSRMLNMTEYLLGGTQDQVFSAAQAVVIGRKTVLEMFMLLAPILLALMVTALVMSISQVGFLFTTEPLRIKFDKLNPVNGFKKLFSGHALVSLLLNITKLGVVSGVVYISVLSEVDKIIFASSMAFAEMVQMAIDIFYRLATRIALVLIVLGIIDWLYQKYRHERSLRMSKEEVKEEMRRMDGDPLMKRRRRETQLKLALQRLRRDVPKADVVVTNPTHLAVALKYDVETMAAPRVVAKGEGYVAERIRSIALEAGIPIVERKPLAKALFSLVEVGREIPPHLYKAVAEVLAFVYELSGRTARPQPIPA